MRCLLVRSTTLALLVLLVPVVSTVASEDKPKLIRGMPSLMDYLKPFLLGSPKKDSINAPQPLLIIGAGFGRTSTSSYMTALKQLGLKTYQMSDGVAGTPGHVDMWYDYMQAVKSTEENHPMALAALDRIVDDMAKHGFHSTASTPACLLYNRLLTRYPKALVILTVRSDGNGQAWARSVQNSIREIPLILQRVPFRWIPRMVKLRTIVTDIFATIGAPFTYDDSENGYNYILQPPSTEALASAYDRWITQVRDTVPSDQLLVFEAKQGWGPLCRFLGQLNDTAISGACAEASKLPYPRVNDAAFFKRIAITLSTVSTIVEYSPLLIILLFVMMTRRWIWLPRRLPEHKVDDALGKKTTKAKMY